ncbi:MAG: hypothetical protein ACFFCW_09435 [Candidatus Hodarchaeota archaeon]
MRTLIQFARFNEIGAIMFMSKTAEAVWPFAHDGTPQTITFRAKPWTELRGVMGYIWFTSISQ